MTIFLIFFSIICSITAQQSKVKIIYEYQDNEFNLVYDSTKINPKEVDKIEQLLINFCDSNLTDDQKTPIEDKEGKKYPNTDSLKTILKETLNQFKIDKYMSFLNSNIQVKDSLMYAYHNSFIGYYESFNTMEANRFIKNVLDPHLRDFIVHPDYQINFIPEMSSEWKIWVEVVSEKFESSLLLQFNFHYLNKLQYVAIII